MTAAAWYAGPIGTIATVIVGLLSVGFAIDFVRGTVRRR